MTETAKRSAASSSDVEPPRVSVVIRSLGRLSSLIELLDNVLAQKHDDFEVIVVEQTPNPDPTAWSRIEQLTRDTRLRILRYSPLGGPGARNTGVLAARADLIILVDDDDLPTNADWIANHEKAFEDPKLMGVTGRHVHQIGEEAPYPRWFRPFVRNRCMRYSFLKTGYTYTRFDEDIDGIEWLHGTNSSFRRKIVERAGMWDTTVATQDEHSFAFRLQQVLHPGEYLAFKTAPSIVRRLDIPGGMDKRRSGMESELRSHLRFLFRIVGKYYPIRFRLLFPAYILWAVGKTIAWIWGRTRITVPVATRITDSLRLFAMLPGQLLAEFKTRSLTPSPTA